MYCKPQNAGLLSDEKACKRTIIKILKTLAEVEGRFEVPPVRHPFFYHPDNEGLSFEYDCMIFRQKLWDRVQTDYRIGHIDHRITLSAHKEKKND